MVRSIPGINLPSPIFKYYAFEAVSRTQFSVPIFILFFTSRGLSLTQVGVLEALWTIVVLSFETPTGYLGDRIGRRRSLAVGALLSATGAVAFIFAHSFVAFATIISLRGIAATFKSGTQEAWLYDTLKTQADSEQFAHYAGRASAIAALA
jgi:MFS family permease